MIHETGLVAVPVTGDRATPVTIPQYVEGILLRYKNGPVRMNASSIRPSAIICHKDENRYSRVSLSALRPT